MLPLIDAVCCVEAGFRQLNPEGGEVQLQNWRRPSHPGTVRITLRSLD